MVGVSVGGGTCLKALTTLIRCTLIISMSRILACIASVLSAHREMGVASRSPQGSMEVSSTSNSLLLTSLLLLSVGEWALA